MALNVICIKVQIVEISSFATRTIYYNVFKPAHINKFTVQYQILTKKSLN